ncbi:24745_t:CDS:2, partial [Gigaspora margarita]
IDYPEIVWSIRRLVEKVEEEQFKLDKKENEKEQLVSISTNKEVRNSEDISSLEKGKKEMASAVERKKKGKEVEGKAESNSENKPNQAKLGKMKISELEKNKMKKKVLQKITVSSAKIEEESLNKTNYKQWQVLPIESYLAGNERDTDINPISRGSTSKESSRSKKSESNSHKISQKEEMQKIEMSSDHKAVTTTIWLGSQVSGTTEAIERNKKYYRTIYLYNNAKVENWKNFRLRLDRNLQKERMVIDKFLYEKTNKDPKQNEQIQIVNYAWNVIKTNIIEVANRSIPKKKELSSLEKERKVLNNDIKIANKKLKIDMPELTEENLEDWLDNMKGGLKYELNKEIKGKSDEIKVVVAAYVDDTTWIVPNKQTMERILSLVSKFFHINDIQINIKKSSFIVFNPKT